MKSIQTINNHQKPLISIIIPVYNVEAYLPQCIESVINQTYSNTEIIIINDGSTDFSGTICDEFAIIDQRIKVFHTDNKGVSEARNLGLRTFKGQYLMFVDGDDWIEKESCENMQYLAGIYDADIVFTSYTKEFHNVSVPKSIYETDKDFIIFDSLSTKYELHRKIVGPIREELKKPEHLDSFVPIYMKLYRREVIEKSYCKFTDLNEIGSWEDGLFNLHVFSDVGKVVYQNKHLYHYRKFNSTSITKKYNPKLRLQWETRDKLIEDYITQHRNEDVFHEALTNRIAFEIIGLGLNMCFSKKSHLLKIKELKSIISSERHKKAFRQLTLNYFPLHWKVFFLFIKLNFALGLYPLLLIMKKSISR